MPHLFDPLTLKDITLRNRIGVSPMCQYSSDKGCATDWHLVHLGSRAVGGAGLIFTEATAVSPEGRITPDDAGLWNEAQIRPLQRINRFLKAHGAVSAIQLAHAGRKGSASRPWEGNAHLTNEAGGYDIIGPTADAYHPEGRLWKTPHAMTHEDIKRVQQAFVEATRRALVAEYDMVELHAAHGYLLHSFTSPLSNQRTDGYGGSLRNRSRMVLETAQAMRQIWPERLPFAVRLSATDWVPEGNNIADTIQIALWLKEVGVDIIDCSAGGASSDSNAAASGDISDQIKLADQVRRGANIMTMAVGGIHEAHQANRIIQSEQADVVLLARQMLRDPYWPFHAAQALGVDAPDLMPIQNGFWVG